MKPSPCVVLFVLCSGLSLCQEQGETRKTPATKLEAFQARTGAVLIRGYSTVGTLRGMSSDVSVDAREFRDGSNPNSPKAMGISITIKETGRLERSNTSYVDVEEIESLIKGIEYISQIGKDVTKLDQFEADYRTKGDLRITVYSGARGEISAAISSGTIGRTSAFIKLGELMKLRDLIVKARSTL